jgi:hypothetical protein
MLADDNHELILKPAQQTISEKYKLKSFQIETRID